MGFFAFAAWHISLRNAPMMFTPLGENKSKLIGSVDVAKAPPGSTLSPLSSLIVAARKVSPRSTPSNDARTRRSFRLAFGVKRRWSSCANRWKILPRY